VRDSSSGIGRQQPEIDPSVPNSARIWNYWLGGKDSYAVDQAAGSQFAEVFPGIVDVARGSRRFLIRAVRFLAGEAGIRQFLDVGTGLPTADNTHEVAQRVAPEARIVYVDNDPVVLAHARALLTSSGLGVTDYVDADLREPDRILEAAEKTLDFGQPVALMLMGVVGHIVDDDDAVATVRRLLDGLAPGSYLTLCDGTDTDPAGVAAQEGYNQSGAVPYRLRSPEQLARFFDGLELVEPGVVSCPLWRPDPAAAPPQPVHAYGGVGRKP
jgi:hypothetical protein